jgi:hypothetical protein
MKQNMGNIDRIVRIVISVVLAVIYFMGYVSGPIGYILLVVAGVFTLTSIIGFCPLYKPVGVDTKN